MAVWTPNADHVPQPLLGIRVVQGRADGKLGMDDMTQHPQFFHRDVPWTAFVLTKPKRPTELSFLWRKITPSDAEVAHRPGYSGSLQMTPRFAEFFVEKAKGLQEKCLALKRSTPTAECPRALTHLPRQMLLVAVALQHSVYDFHHLQYMWASFQRFYLEVMALYDYLTKWMPLMAKTTLSNEACIPVNDKLMGAFTDDPIIVMKLARLGVPVWRICRSHDVPRNICIARICFVTPSQVVLEPAVPPLPVLYRGYAGGASAVAGSDIVPGGIQHGLGTKTGLYSLHPEARKQLSRVEEVGESAMGSASPVYNSQGVFITLVFVFRS